MRNMASPRSSPQQISLAIMLSYQGVISKPA